jgi:hypothetical protein
LPKFWGGVCGGEGAELSGWQGENCGLKEKTGTELEENIHANWHNN